MISVISGSQLNSKPLVPTSTLAASIISMHPLQWKIVKMQQHLSRVSTILAILIR